MRHLTSTQIMQQRITKWMANAQPLQLNSTWTERRLAIDIGDHTYLIQDGYVYQCANCGHYDPQWSAQEVASFMEQNIGAKTYEIEVTCSVDLGKK